MRVRDWIKDAGKLHFSVCGDEVNFSVGWFWIAALILALILTGCAAPCGRPIDGKPACWMRDN
ncbi:hypothetical protein [Microvirga brassicacearum]|uniref:Uncharacterized protein n=1 Tax=Microvirga brassicacearum TaxID=2580413 RepID=A0A5N3PH44_9HYPH|nr:hypothetical protein [Microvirga brassicacearum]KAB0269030.1 hypothetical protein FEZ63_02675 [Microvirga brassicacearum]